MKYVLIFSLLLTGLGSCEDKNAKEGCKGPDDHILKDVKCAFLESGFVLIDMAQDSALSRRIPYMNFQPCTPVNTTNLKIQKDKAPITINYQITCGVKYPESGIYYNLPPAPKIVIYSIKPL